MISTSVAVRVDRVSKIYRLWNSPRDRLMHPLRRIAISVLPAALCAKHIKAHEYHEFHALHDITFEILKGESWGFIGVNGSGKSTLLKIISGNLRPSTGTVEVDGKTAILDYGSGLNGDFTGRDNVYLKGSLLGLSKKQIDERFEAIAGFADIGQFIDQPVKTYSSGMTARLGFAIMAHVDAEIMITDEALAVGDAFYVQKCMRHIRSFLKRGTFLFVSHSVNDVMSLCTHAIWLEQGRVVRTGKARDVCAAYIDSLDRRKSEAFLDEKKNAASDDPCESEPLLDPQNEVTEFMDKQPITKAVRQISLSGDELATLRNYYAPPTAIDTPAYPRTPLVEIQEQGSNFDDAFEQGGALGGGKIFSVTLTNGKGEHVSTVLGGEIVCLTLRAIAEKPIERPILGFQLNNHLGLTLIAENTFPATNSKNVRLNPGEIITAKFRFLMPLVSLGEYMIRSAIADGVEDNNALIDVKHEALLLRCTSSGVRHGLVGIPMIGIEVVCEQAPTGSYAE